MLAALLALALLPLIIAGRDRLSIGGRLSAAIEQAAAGNRRLSLRSFAEIPWTRLYVFEPGTVRARIADMIGENSVATAADRHVMVPYPSVQTATTLLVFVAGKDIVRTIVLRDSSADLTGASYPRQCYLRPTDVLKVLTTSPPRLMIRTRSRCRRSPLPTTGAVG
ncbi:MAG: hypothetical protein QOG94_3743 [Solirubrobacteraceae bacterium]|nr:hypothetical protein [Solirubrobacteraceae bacterium]